jgi:hypothetical protein
VHEHRSTHEACASIGKWIAEYEHHPPKAAQSYAGKLYNFTRAPIRPEVPYSDIVQKERSMTRMCISLSYRD